jgi:AraC family transcriptional regulator
MENPIYKYKHLMEYIENNIHDVITLEKLEKESGLSRFQLTRFFIKLCGHSPIDYIRRRKLSKSIPDLYNKRKILDIAIDYGFEYEQSYIRAFRSVFHFSPTQLRKNHQAVTLTEPPKLHDIKIYTDGFLLSPNIKFISNRELFGEEKYYNYKDNNIYGKPLLDGLAQNKGGIFTGICIPCGSGTFTHKYISCHSTPQQNSISYTLPKGKYAVFNYTGFHNIGTKEAHMLRTLMYIVINSWAYQNKFHWREHFIEQVNFDLLSENYSEIDIMVPIR